MAKPILNEALWAVLELRLPPDPPRPRSGRPRLPHRRVLTGILFVLRSGIPWELLPKELGCGSGMTCWRRLQEWQAKAFGSAFITNCSTGSRQLEELDWSRASLDSSSVAAKPPVPTRPIGAKQAPSATWSSITRASRWRSKSRPLMITIGQFSSPRRRPEKLHADKAYDARHCRAYLRRRGIKSRIARKGIESGERLSPAPLSWSNAPWPGSHRFRRLTIRYERRADLYEAFFLHLGCILVCWNLIHRKGFC